MIGVIFQWVRCYSLYRNSSHLDCYFYSFLYLLFFVSRRVRHTSVLNNPPPGSTIKGHGCGGFGVVVGNARGYGGTLKHTINRLSSPDNNPTKY